MQAIRVGHDVTDRSQSIFISCPKVRTSHFAIDDMFFLAGKADEAYVHEQI